MDPLFELGLLIKAGRRDLERRANGDRRRRRRRGIVLPLAGRRKEEEATRARAAALARGRTPEPLPEALRETAQLSPFGELVTRRRELYEGEPARTG
jgi:hypothetical protein